MPRTSRRMLAALALAPLLLLGLPAAAHAADPTPPANELDDLLGDRIAGLAESGQSLDEIADLLALPENGAGSLRIESGGRVSASILFRTQPDDALIAQVSALAEVTQIMPRFLAATVITDPRNLDDLADLPGVLSVTPDMDPFIDGGSPTSAPARPAAVGTSCRSVPVEADGPLGSAEARALFGVDGTGVTIGIVSDSFAAAPHPSSTWEQDIAAGALPGPGNPCGRLAPVEIIADGAGKTDEGRAMAQLVHGIAPGARILFADYGRNELEMAMNIEKLAKAGAQIIVDDISYMSEMYYQKGFIGSMIDEVKADYGVAYFTSAGNSNTVSATGKPIASWQTSAYRPTSCPAWVRIEPEMLPPGASAANADCLNFATQGVQAWDTFVLRPDPDEDMFFSLVGSIGEPMFGVTTSYQVQYYLYDGTTDPVLGRSIPRMGSASPSFNGSIKLPRGTQPITVRIVMVRTAHDSSQPNPAVYIASVGNTDPLLSRQFLGNGTIDRVGPTVFGHSGDGSAVSVGSVLWNAPATIQPYSSLGPGTQIFEAAGGKKLVTGIAPAKRLPAPVSVAAPNVMAVDGTLTTFFGTHNRFNGTSAAAPHAAAVAALAKSYAPQTSGEELTRLVLLTARGESEGGPVNPYRSAGVADADAVGAGIVDARRLLAALPAPVTPTPTPTVEPTPTPTASPTIDPSPTAAPDPDAAVTNRSAADLARTGVDSGLLIGVGVAAVVVIGVGVLLLVVRRRSHRD